LLNGNLNKILLSADYLQPFVFFFFSLEESLPKNLTTTTKNPN